MALSSSVAVKQLSDANSQGTILGQSVTDRIAFYGMASTGVAVQNSTIIGGNYATTCTAPAQSATTASVTTWGFGSSTQANALIGLLDWAYRSGLIR